MNMATNMFEASTPINATGW